MYLLSHHLFDDVLAGVCAIHRSEQLNLKTACTLPAVSTRPGALLVQRTQPLSRSVDSQKPNEYLPPRPALTRQFSAGMF